MTRYTPLDYIGRNKPVWCAGCGDYGVLTALFNVFSQKKIDAKNVAIISGIGCSGRLPDFIKAYGFHGAHGRALPIAIGVKVANPSERFCRWRGWRWVKYRCRAFPTCCKKKY
ncbi:MAG: pyruvate synthase beta chain [Candidatus Scalindua brodae]|uniref:Pyruvate synthase beta chain n=1 Tax=Candidatus Scalindua brodae TaxID=237368 RepID=A0A0B0EM03_9BACT|nr:MAG: pyruvate synthase beta chain [Candidatus Scalindua brodae]